ncbi:MAG: cob(I)yrinic acid a,c-diamide adenosyltransferase [Chloroflexi bacterium]|nr:cob(I)yrinic acid a,c-diamide adenosyltransferase [Chloroflexota bacterium]
MVAHVKPGARVREKEKNTHGLLIVYTGEGKGKTTAALGMAMRAVGRGWRVLMIQFGKGSWHYAELESSKRLAPEFEIVPMGLGFYKILDDAHLESEHRRAALEALALAQAKMEAGEYDMLILDEINGVIAARLVPLDAVLKLLDAKPEGLTLVLTGRYAPQEIIDRADLVTEMREIKHPYQKGMLAQKGIDY